MLLINIIDSIITITNTEKKKFHIYQSHYNLFRRRFRKKNKKDQRTHCVNDYLSQSS